MGGCCNCCIMDNPIGDFVRDIFGGGSGGGCGYHPGPSETEAHAKKIADELASMKEGIRKSSEKKEQEIIDHINKSMDELINFLESINKTQFGGKTLNINIKGIKEKNNVLAKEVVGYIGNIMDDRLVLTDKELSIILEERNDEKRGKNFDAFCKKIQSQALSGLSEKIESTVRKQEEVITKEIKIRLEEVNKSMEEAILAYNEILETKKSDESEMEKIEIKHIFKNELSSILLDELGGV
jgi:hypothetical protein